MAMMALTDNDLSSPWAISSTGGEDKAYSSRDKSHAGTLGDTGVLSLFAPLRKKDINHWLLTMVLPIGACLNEIATTYTPGWKEFEHSLAGPGGILGVLYYSSSYRVGDCILLSAHQAENLLNPYCRCVSNGEPDGVGALCYKWVLNHSSRLCWQLVQDPAQEPAHGLREGVCEFVSSSAGRAPHLISKGSLQDITDVPDRAVHLHFLQ